MIGMEQVAEVAAAHHAIELEQTDVVAAQRTDSDFPVSSCTLQSCMRESSPGDAAYLSRNRPERRRSGAEINDRIVPVDRRLAGLDRRDAGPT